MGCVRVTTVRPESGHLSDRRWRMRTVAVSLCGPWAATDYTLGKGLAGQQID